MDFWASLEHKIYYKYNQAIPEHLTDELREAALSAAELDRKMERLHNEITDLKKNGEEQNPLEEQMLLPLELLAKLRQTRV
jgi:putative GTP pyrophosphokinase